MDPLGIARWQFGITTVYHFLFVPITIGMAFFIAIIETAWVRTRNPIYLRATKFWGKIFLINFAIGVVTGIVQEFQFGMNWSSYSRFVGDVFGAPLAMEALLAFFLESTFLGLWIFGWDKLPPRLHAHLHLAGVDRHHAVGVLHHGGQLVHAAPGGHHRECADGPRRDERLLGGADPAVEHLGVLRTSSPPPCSAARRCSPAISAYFLMKRRDVAVFRPSVRLGLVGMLIGSLAVLVTGDLLAKVMTDVQPMKMAAAEALWNTDLGRVVLADHHRHPGRLQRGVVDPGAGRAVVHGDRVVLRHGRGHQRRAGRSSRRSTARATTGRTSP